MSNIKEIFQIGFGCLAMPLMFFGFIVFIAALPLCFIVGIGELIIWGIVGLLLKPFGIDIFTGKSSNVIFIIGCIMLIVIVAIIFFTYPNLFFNFLLFGDESFPRMKP